MAEQIGEYNRKIEIWQRKPDVDAAGEHLVGDAGWVLYKPLWAKIRGRNGMGWIREIGSAQGKEVQASLDLESFRVRYREDITPDMQVRWRGRVLEIILIRLDLADREYTDIIVRTGGGDGS